MGDFTRNRSSPPRNSASAIASALCAAGAATAPGTMISAAGLATATIWFAPGFFSRMRKSPREYSNSSRLCSLMNRSNCSICPISGFANYEPPLDFFDFFRFMPLLEFDEIPLDAGQNFTALGANCNVVFYPNATDAVHIYTRFYGNHISRFQSNRLAVGDPRRLVHLQPQAVARAVHEIFFKPVLLQDFPGRCVHFPAGDSGIHCGYRSLVGLLHRPVPSPDSVRCPAHVDRACNVAAIVGEYSTQVQHHQLIFLQPLGGRARVG